MTLTDLGLITDECTPGIVEGVQAAWQRMCDARFTSLREKFPSFVEQHGETAVRDAVMLVIAGSVLRAASGFCYEIAVRRGGDHEKARARVKALIEIGGET